MRPAAGFAVVPTAAFETLLKEVGEVRERSAELERSLAGIQKSIEENRVLMNKVIDLAVGKMFGGAAGGETPPPRRGLLSRVFGGGQGE
jgi:hypothetical protein